MGAGPKTYRVVGTVGTGRHGELWLAEVVGTRDRVVIEPLTSPTEADLAAFTEQAASLAALEDPSALRASAPMQLGDIWAVVHDHVVGFGLDRVVSPTVDVHPGTALAIVNQLAQILGRRTHGDLQTRDVIMDPTGVIHVANMYARGASPSADVLVVGTLLGNLLERRPEDEVSDALALAREMSDPDPARRPDWSQVGHWCDAVRALARGPRLKTWATSVLEDEPGPVPNAMTGKLLSEIGAGAVPISEAATMPPSDDMLPLIADDLPLNHTPDLPENTVARDMEAEAAAQAATHRHAEAQAVKAEAAQRKAERAEAEALQREQQIAEIEAAQAPPQPATTPLATLPHPVTPTPDPAAPQPSSSARSALPLLAAAALIGVLALGTLGLAGVIWITTGPGAAADDVPEVAEAPPEDPTTPGLTAGFDRHKPKPGSAPREAPRAPPSDDEDVVQVMDTPANDIEPDIVVGLGRAAVIRLAYVPTGFRIRPRPLETTGLPPYLVVSASQPGLFTLEIQFETMGVETLQVSVAENSNTDPHGDDLVSTSERLGLSPNTGAACTLPDPSDTMVIVDPEWLSLEQVDDHVIYLHANDARVVDVVLSQGRAAPRIITVDATAEAGTDLPEGCIRAPDEAIRIPLGGKTTTPVDHAAQFVFTSDQRVIEALRPDDDPNSITIRGLIKGQSMVVVGDGNGAVWLRRVVVE